MSERDDDRSVDEALAGLERGDFSRLEPLFDTRMDSGTEPLIVEWVKGGRFRDHANLLAEALTCACFLGKIDVVAYLLSIGVDPAAGKSTGLDAIHWAANRGQLDAVRLLISGGSRLDSVNMYGGSVAGVTVWSALNEPRPDHPEILEELLAAGAPFPNEDYPSGEERIDTILRRYGT